MSVFDAIAVALQIYFFILIARALVSWFRPDPYNPIIRFLYDVTEPVLQPVRNLLPRTGMLDLSMLVVLILLQILISALRSL